VRQQEIHSFLNQFFTSTDCQIEESTPHSLTVQLTIDMDKALMNRPFYWHYIEKTGGVPNPQKLHFMTNMIDSNNSKDKKGEFIHFGSPRLHQVFSLTKKLGAYIRLFEKSPNQAGINTALYPWLCLNLKISYICDRKKDLFHSIGLNLINGAMLEDFHSHICQFEDLLVAKIPDYSYTLSPLIKPISGIRRIQQYVLQQINQQDHTWAIEARKRWNDDIQLLDRFYEDLDEKPESYFIEKEALKEQYEPRIEISIINGGMFYLRQDRFLSA